MNGRILGDTVGKLTSFQYNGSSTVDYCVVDQKLLDSVNFFKIGDFTTFSDHCQITACFSLSLFENIHKLGRKPRKGITLSKHVANAFQSLIVSDSVKRSIQFFYPSLGIPLSLRLMRQPKVSLLFIKLLIYL